MKRGGLRSDREGANREDVHAVRKLRPVVEDGIRVTTSPRVTPRGEGRVVGATENALEDIG